MLRELQVGHLARANGYVLVRNHRGYDLWCAKHGRFALRSCTLLDVKTYLATDRVNMVKENIAKRRIEREPLFFSAAHVTRATSALPRED